MRYFWTLVVFLVLMPQIMLAAYIAEPKTPFEVPQLENIQAETVYGNLNGFPHTFTFSISEDTPFTVQVSMFAGDVAKDVSLILIKQEKRGVSEIGRVTGKNTTWTDTYDVWRAITFSQAPVQKYVLESGTYRLEVSSPENNRGYRLMLGRGDSSLPREIFTVRKIFEVSPWGVLLSPFILGFLISSFGVLYYRKKKQYAT